MSDTFLCQLDHVVGHPHGLFGFGWCLHPRGRVAAGSLELSFPDGTTRRVDVSIGRPREDVAAAFPTHPHAGNAGFMLLAGWPAAAPLTATLRFALADGSSETVPLVLPDLAAPRRPAGVGWRYLARRGWAHLRRGRLRALVHRVRERRRRAGCAARPLDLAGLGAILRGRTVALVVDHAMGGGANTYRERLVAELGAQSAVVVVLTFSVSALALVAEVRVAGAVPRAVTLDSLESLAAALAQGRLTTVAYNCAVSFPRPLEVRDLLLALRRSRGARLLVAVHDYFTVCPSSFLLDDAGRYCGVPDLERCSRCLPAHADGFVSLAGVRSVTAWRDAWGGLLAAADEIRCFSESSRRLLDRAYPGLGSRALLRPHDVAPLRRVRPPAPGHDGPLVLGVIGSISTHKGAAVVADLAAAIAVAGAAVRIVVVGHVDAACPPGVVVETGPYEPAQLPGLVERHGIGMALLPSICPETFSFVAHEILAMGLPLICLDLGAQADLARAHPRGRVAARADGEGLLAEVLDFAATLAGAGHEVPA